MNLNVTDSDMEFAAQILEDFGTFEEGIEDQEKLAQWVRNIRCAALRSVPADDGAKAYIERAIASYVGDPPDNQFQKGFLAALEVVRDEAFCAPTPPNGTEP